MHIDVKWTPVTDRLPECKCDCILHTLLATLENDDPGDDPEVGVVDFDCMDNKFYYSGCSTPHSYWKVTAWAYMPKPYKGGGSDINY